MPETVRLTLLSRAYCSLCDEMRAALLPIAARHDAEVVELDVDSDGVLEEAYGELVPVLLAGPWGDTREVCPVAAPSNRASRAGKAAPAPPRAQAGVRFRQVAPR
jgi:thioredoxin reductase (NADPH)